MHLNVNFKNTVYFIEIFNKKDFIIQDFFYNPINGQFGYSIKFYK